MEVERARKMDVERAIRTQRAMRRFRDEPLADDDLRAILDAGRRSGSSKNLQRWDFIVVRDRATLKALANVGPFAGHLAAGAAAIALVTPDPAAGEPLSVMWDLGRAAQNMTLAAWGRGVGSVPATVYDQKLCRRILGYPADHHCEYLLNFGYPVNPDAATRPLRKGGRRPIEDVVFYERWGASAGPEQPS
jgi:nitroreductase